LWVDATRTGPIAAAVAEEVEDYEAVAGRNERDDIVPQMARRRKSVNKHGWYSGASRAGRIVVQPSAGEVEKLTAHARL
jgi:hypothetical protein